MLTINAPLVSVEWLHGNFDAQNLVVLDGSMPKVTANNDEDDLLQIPKARFFDIKKKFSDASAPFPNTVPSQEQFNREAQNLGVNNDSAIVVYDDKGIYSSARVWYLFKAFGHDNVAVLDGGLPEWIQKGFQTEEKNTNVNYTKGGFTGTYQPNYFKFFNDIKIISDDSSCKILDARSRTRFLGEVPEPREGLRSGHIPNSISLPFANLIEGNCMKPKSKLFKIFSDLNISDKKLIFSCGSGITACILALAAEVSGYKNLSVYDGSWTEYGSLTP